MGIHNLGQNKKLPHELQILVQICQVEEVVFLLDSDWYKISENIKPGEQVDSRPWSFYRAVQAYKEYLKTFNNIGVYIEIYFGYINENEKKDKGIDDLLTITLKGKEDLLNEDVEFAINEKTGIGEYLSIHKITTAN